MGSGKPFCFQGLGNPGNLPSVASRPGPQYQTAIGLAVEETIFCSKPLVSAQLVFFPHGIDDVTMLD